MTSSEPVFGGYALDELTAAFGLVKNPGNWKLAVDAVIGAGVSRDLVEAALLFFAGSPPVFISLPDGRARVLAAGYYACIGA